MVLVVLRPADREPVSRDAEDGSGDRQNDRQG
jgi:hypothetical protein